MITRYVALSTRGRGYAPDQTARTTLKPRMHFDDRLDTVMRTPLRSDAARLTQYRQLIDILAQKRAERIDPERLDEAYALLDRLSQKLPLEHRASVIAETGDRIETPRLLSMLALHEPEIARPAMRGARLDDAEWLALIPTIPPEVRDHLNGRSGLSRQVHDRLARIGVEAEAPLRSPLPPESAPSPPPSADEQRRLQPSEPEPRPSRLADIPPPPFITRSALGLEDDPEDEAAPSADRDEPLELDDPIGDPIGDHAAADDAPADQDGEAPSVKPQTEPVPLAPTVSDPAQNIGELVKRIESFRKTREPGGDGGDASVPAAPRLPLDELQGEDTRITAIDFTTDRLGRIIDAPRTVAPMLVGYSLSGASERIGRNVRRRLPIVDEMLDISGAPAVVGQWRLDAMPVFEPDGGRFMHFRGRLRRPGKVVTRATKRAEKLRQLLHELRTPVNAIQGFAESIQQQIFGDVPHTYRAYAATIASDSAAMMAGFEELELFARLTGGEIELAGEGCDLSVTISQTLDQLATYTQPRVSGFKCRLAEPPVPIAMSQSDGERLVWRLLGTLAGETAPGEFLSLRLTVQGDTAQFSAGIPRRLGEREGEKLFEGGIANGQNAISAGMFGSGFALRVARAEARAAGGELQRDGDELVLSLPLTAAATPNSDDQAEGAEGASGTGRAA